MKSKFKISAILVLSMMIASCDHNQIEDNGSEPILGETHGIFTGTVDGTGNGYKSTIKVVLELASGIITAIQIEHNDTPKYADEVIPLIKNRVLKTNSFDDLDAISGATGTRKGIVEAGRNALGKIPSEN